VQARRRPSVASKGLQILLTRVPRDQSTMLMGMGYWQQIGEENGAWERLRAQMPRWRQLLSDVLWTSAALAHRSHIARVFWRMSEG